MPNCNYQDTYIKGTVVSYGERACRSRYDFIRQLLSKYRRRFTLLDLGANLGYMSFNAADEFDCVSVAVERNRQPLLDLCYENDNSNVIFLNHTLTIDSIHELSTCEHFDVVLALNILHHFDSPIQALESVMSLGDNIIIEVPPPDDINSCGQSNLKILHRALLQLSCQVLGYTYSHVTPNVSRPILLVSNRKQHITRAYLDVPNGVELGLVSIQSDFDGKSVMLHRKGECRPWIHGINLRTWQLMNGVYPSRSRMSEMIRETHIDGVHNDIQPWNMILDGGNIYLIDNNDDRVTTVDNNAGLAAVVDSL